jgi:phage-related protein (TIGR01555 family)
MTDAKNKPNPEVYDGLKNVVTGLGGATSKRYHDKWELAMFGNYAELDACYTSNWIAGKIVDIPAVDMTREWRRIKSDGAEDIAVAEVEHGLQQKVQEAVGWARLYGGSGILMLTDQDLTKPLRPELIKKGSLKSLKVFDRYDIVAGTINTWDILADNYLSPEFYTIRGGQMNIHTSHIARFIGVRLPLRLQQLTQGWGASFLRKCLEEITDMAAANQGIAELMREANIDVITRNGLADDLTTGQQAKIIERYELFSMMKGNIRMALLDGGDGEGGGSAEKFERKTLNLSGVAPVIEQFMTLVSGAADIPVTRMFGTSAKGMNATGEGDDRNYNASIRAQQTNYLPGPLRTLDEVLVRSALGNFPKNYDYVWNPLALPDNLENAQTEKLQADKHILYLDNGIVQKSQIMRELQADEQYQYDDKELEELEELEVGNLFEEPPIPDPDPTPPIE